MAGGGAAALYRRVGPAPLRAAAWPAPVGGCSRSPAAGGGVWGKPVKPSDGREGYKAANRAAAAAGAAAWSGEGGGLYLGRRRPDIYRVARLEVSVGAADADLNLQPTPWQLYLYVTLSRGWSNSEGARIYGEVARAFITPRHAAVPPYERARACGACVAGTRKLSVWPMRPTSCCNSCFCTQQRRLWLCAGCRTNVYICMYGTHPSSATGRLEAVAGFCLQCAALSGRP